MKDKLEGIAIFAVLGVVVAMTVIYIAGIFSQTVRTFFWGLFL